MWWRQRRCVGDGCGGGNGSAGVGGCISGGFGGCDCSSVGNGNDNFGKLEFDGEESRRDDSGVEDSSGN